MLRGATVVGLLLFLTTDAHADDTPLPMPRLVPNLTLGKDKGLESEPAEDSWSTRKKTISLAGGAPGGPTGVAGLTFEYAPSRYFVLGTGGGWAPEGPRGAFMPRLRLPLNHHVAIGMGFPISAGPYQYSLEQREQCEFAGCATPFKTTRTWAIAVWGHIEPNIEIRITPAAALRLYGGYARVLNDTSDRCDSTLPSGCPSSIGEDRFYGGFSLGYAW